jgi:hypothetical protein
MIGMKLFLRQYRAFWRLRARFADAEFAVRRAVFSLRSRVSEEADSSSAIGYIVRLTLFDFAAAVVLSALVWWANTRLAFLKLSLNDAAYVQFASGVVGAGAVFIGLYYAAVTAAMTAVYSQMPNSVSQLLMRERFGNSYMRFVATLTFMAVNLLALHALGIQTGTAAPPVLALGSGIAVFGFVKLGTWAFRLFDPTAVSYAVFREGRGLFNQVVVGGYQWRDGAFQDYAQRRCAQLLRAISDLADACQHSPYLRQDPLARLAVATLGFAQFSVGHRARIPTKSRWYATSYSQPSWYRSPDTQTSIAYHTGTLLQPETVQKQWWLEQQCQEVVFSALTSLLSRRELETARSLLSACESYVESLARHGWISEASSFIDRIEGPVLLAILDAETPAGESLVDRVALLDYVGRLRVLCVLEAANWADGLSRSRLQAAVDRVDWRNPSAPYDLGLHAYSIARAEWLAERLNFERLVDGEQVSPSWYCCELLAQQDAEALARAAEVLCRESFVRIRSAIDHAMGKERLWEAACLLSDALHNARKMEHHLERLQAAMARVSTDRRVKKLSWPDPDFKKLAAAVADEYAWVVERMSVLMPRLPAKPEELPDYRGQFLHTVTEQVFEYVLAGDPVPLARTLPGAFAGCFAMHAALSPIDFNPEDPWLEGSLSVAVAPIMDLVELSGYSYVLSEAFPDKPTWSTVAGVWDRALGAAAAGALAKQVAAIVSFSKNQFFSIPPRAVLRTTWQQRVQRALSTLPVKLDHRGFGVDYNVDHPSALVRAVFHPDSIGMMEDGADIFAAVYLLARQDMPANVVHRQAADLVRRVAQEKLRAGQSEEQNDADPND